MSLNIRGALSARLTGSEVPLETPYGDWVSPSIRGSGSVVILPGGVRGGVPVENGFGTFSA